MRQDYEEMKSDAQIEEYKFMEKTMNQYGYQVIEQKIKRWISEIKFNSQSRLSQDNLSLDDVREFKRDHQQKIMQLYEEKQKQMFKQIDYRLF